MEQTEENIMEGMDCQLNKGSRLQQERDHEIVICADR